MDDKWRVIGCGTCRGYGTVSVYSATDFEGPGDCPECDGTGAVWLRPTGHAFAYPGGPAKGVYSPDDYKIARAVGP